MHYVKLRKSHTGNQALCARGWLECYFRAITEFCPYYCLAIDTKSSAFDCSKYPQGYLAYNHFVKLLFNSAIPWCLKRYSKIALTIFSDAKTRPARDNFAVYLPREVLKTNNVKHSKDSRKYPDIRLSSKSVIMVDSDPNKNTGCPEDCELIQLVDLLTSAVSQSITGSSGQKAKLVIGALVANMIEDTRLPPWMQTKTLHRHFQVACYPDSHGDYYEPELYGSEANSLQLPMSLSCS